MRAGIGYQNRKDARDCGRLAAEQALRQGNIHSPSLVLAFCSGSLDAAAFRDGLISVVGSQVPILGGDAIGIITNDAISYEGSPGGVAILELDQTTVHVASEGGLDKGEHQAGAKLGRRFSDLTRGDLLLMFYDSIKVPATPTSPPLLNASPPLIAGLQESMGFNVPIVGAGLMGDYAFSAGQQFCGSFVGKQQVAACILNGPTKPLTRIMHGCTPMDGIYHTITRLEGPVIYEIDGRPAADLVDRIYGSRDWRNQTPVKRLAIGINHGEKFTDYREEVFVNRLIAGVMPQTQGLVLFEPDLQEGAEVLFMLRDGAVMVDSARKNTLEMMASVQRLNKRPQFALYIDCAGRTAAQSETLTEEAAEVQTVLNQHRVPLLGFYSGVEIAPMLGRSRGLDWTGVLLLLVED